MHRHCVLLDAHRRIICFRNSVEIKNCLSSRLRNWMLCKERRCESYISRLQIIFQQGTRCDGWTWRMHSWNYILSSISYQVDQINSRRIVTTNVNASGNQTHTTAALLVHDSPRHGDLVVLARRLRGGVLNDMDSGKILALRVGGAVSLPKLQMSFAGRLTSSGVIDGLYLNYKMQSAFLNIM